MMAFIGNMSGARLLLSGCCCFVVLLVGVGIGVGVMYLMKKKDGK
jgi:hypothetical protein